mgnify:CR=1 FL=1
MRRPLLSGAVVVTVALLATAPREAIADDPFGYSGLCRIEGSTFLAVRDLKHGLEHEPRILILRVRTEAEIDAERARTGMRVPATETEPLRLRDLPEGVPIASDLEACCLVPGRPGEFLLAESGFFRGRYGRVFHARIEPRDGRWEARYLSHFHPFPVPEGGTTSKHAQVEGMTMFSLPQGDPVLVLGLRGHGTRTSWTPAELVWGTIRWADQKAVGFNETDRAPLRHTPPLVRARGCADLFLLPGSNPWTVWTAATHDFGDVGPFRSLVYEAGRFDFDAESGVLSFRPPKTIEALWSVRGLKIEGLAGPAEAVPGSIASIATECEAFGGVWRPLELVPPLDDRCPDVSGAGRPTAGDLLRRVQARLEDDFVRRFVPAHVQVVQFHVLSTEDDPDFCAFHFVRGDDRAWSRARRGIHPGYHAGDLDRAELVAVTMDKACMRRLFEARQFQAFERQFASLRASGGLGTFGTFLPAEQSGARELFELIRR